VYGAAAFDQGGGAAAAEFAPEIARGLAELGEDDDLLAAEFVLEELAEAGEFWVGGGSERGELLVQGVEPLAVEEQVAAQAGCVEVGREWAQREFLEVELRALQIAPAIEGTVVGGEAEESALEGGEAGLGEAELAGDTGSEGGEAGFEAL
jgi:hypothetical protein